MTRCRFCVFALLLLATFLLARPSDVAATQKFGPLELSGNLQTQNLVRMPDASTYQFIQNRNVARLRLDPANPTTASYPPRYRPPGSSMTTALAPPRF